MRAGQILLCDHGKSPGGIFCKGAAYSGERRTSEPGDRRDSAVAMELVGRLAVETLLAGIGTVAFSMLGIIFVFEIPQSFFAALAGRKKGA